MFMVTAMLLCPSVSMTTRGYALSHQQRGAGMPQRVEAHVGQASLG